MNYLTFTLTFLEVILKQNVHCQVYSGLTGSTAERATLLVGFNSTHALIGC